MIIHNITGNLSGEKLLIKTEIKSVFKIKSLFFSFIFIKSFSHSTLLKLYLCLTFIVAFYIISSSLENWNKHKQCHQTVGFLDFGKLKMIYKELLFKKHKTEYCKNAVLETDLWNSLSNF